MTQMTAPTNRLPLQLDAAWKQFQAMTDAELDSELTSIMEVAAGNLVRLALILRQKEERGHDLASLKIGMLGYLRKIAYGQLLPDVVARFGSHPGVLRRIATLPLPDQRRCLDDEGIKVALWDGEKIGHRICDPTSLSPAELKQVFAADHVRAPDEQVAWIRRQPINPRRAATPVTVDKKHREIVVTGENVRISREQLLMYLASLG